MFNGTSETLALAGKKNYSNKKFVLFDNKKVSYNYYSNLIDNKEVIIRVYNKGNISDNISTLEVYKNGSWLKDGRIIKSFINKYITGWIIEEDVLDINIVEEAINSGMSYRTIIARNLAVEMHNGQKYGSYPYKLHLANVVSVLLHFCFSFKDDIIIMSAWLHVIEDTDVDKSLISRNFGEEVREIVELVTNQNNTDKTKEENKKETFNRISTNQNAIIVKLADRISNIEFSLLHGNIDKLNKYKNEQPLLDKLIKPKITSDEGKRMYNHLESLII